MKGVLLRAILLALLALAGCKTQIESDPTTFDVRRDAAPRLRGQQSIALANAYSGPAIVVVARAPGNEARADMREFTNTAIGMLERRMKEDGIAIDAAASKRVTLRVKDARVLGDGFAALSTVTMEADLGDGSRSVLRINNNSTTPRRALDGALVRGVTQLLNDKQFLAYVNGP